MTVELLAKTLEAVAQITGDDITRPALSSVKIGSHSLIATDGYMVFIAPHKEEIEEDVFIRNSVIKGISTDNHLGTVLVESDKGEVNLSAIKKSGKVSIESAGVTHMDYPEVDRIIPPLRKDTISVTLNLKLLEKIINASKKMKTDKGTTDTITFHVNTEGNNPDNKYIQAIRFELSAIPESYGAIMPFKR